MLVYNKHSLYITAISAVILILGIVFGFLYRDDKTSDIVPATRIAVIDSARLKSEAICFKEREKLENMLSDILTKMHNFEVESKTAYEQARNDKNLTRQQREKKIEQIEHNWSKTSGQYKAEIESIKKMDFNLSNFLQEKLNKVIEIISQRYKIDVVLNAQIGNMISVFYATKGVDMTEIVINMLNETVKQVNLEDLKS